MRSLGTFIAAAALAVLAASHASAVELVYGTGSGAKSRINIDAIEPFVAETTKESGGSITWKYLPGNQIVTIRTALKGLRDNLVDAGMVVPVYVRKDLIEINSVYDTVFFGDDDIVASAGAAHETLVLHCPECVAEFGKNNSFLLASYASSEQVLACTKPVKTVAELKGLKIRAPGPLQRVAKALGGVPVSLPPQELALALDRGGLDCAFTPLNWMISFGIQDVAKYVVDYHFGSSRALGLIVMNRDTWRKKLTREQRRILWQRAPLASARSVVVSYIQLDAKYRKTIGPTKGVQFFKAGSDFTKIMDGIRSGAEKVLVAEISKQGAKQAAKTVAAFTKTLAKWRKLSQTEIKNDTDAYARVLKREIYDKLDPEKL
ncbi:MAG: hypothetical protein A3G25_15295 [Betaproteobacteria bacterium RIFCSPLOWO2_12_FULL_63_13]|nr:MAG: hypothetical protein A3G25_15295 [Betaproteobacteria bacterium RIFCSPLOWO2_12_FULL_63_13]